MPFLVPWSRLRTLALAAAYGASPLFALQLTSPSVESASRFESTTNEVTHVFTVLDRRGRPVTGLESKDFSVSDDGIVVEELKGFTQQSDTPLHIAMAIDLSGSVHGRVKYEIDLSTKFLQRVIRPTDDGWIIGFNFLQYPVADWTLARDTLTAVARRYPSAGTAFYDTVILACKHLATSGGNSHRRDVLIVISDGEDNASRSGFGETLQTVSRSGVIVLVVYTGNSSSTRELRTLAESTGGEFFYASTKRGVLNGLARAEQAIRGQYLIAYRPASFAPDGRFRSVHIRSLREGLKVRCRRGYYASSPASTK